jgi:hypothetical protein
MVTICLVAQHFYRFLNPRFARRTRTTANFSGWIDSDRNRQRLNRDIGLFTECEWPQADSGNEMVIDFEDGTYFALHLLTAPRHSDLLHKGCNNTETKRLSTQSRRHCPTA